jgi:hypothetical protein
MALCGLSLCTGILEIQTLQILSVKLDVGRLDHLKLQRITARSLRAFSDPSSLNALLQSATKQEGLAHCYALNRKQLGCLSFHSSLAKG